MSGKLVEFNRGDGAEYGLLVGPDTIIALNVKKGDTLKYEKVDGEPSGGQYKVVSSG